MYVTLTLVWAIFIVGAESSVRKQCNDCVPLPRCEIATELLKNNNEETRSIVMSSVCYIKKDLNKIDVVSVCCSDFLDRRMLNDEIENHKNRKLLPNGTICGRRLGNKIAGGSNADLNQFPWMVMLLDQNNTPMCGASLINERYVLTAAHCVRSLNSHLTKVRLGEYDFSKTVDCTFLTRSIYKCIRYVDLEFSKRIIHPMFKINSLPVNDIALVRLATPANFSKDNIKPICLPIPENLRNKELDDNDAIIIGWGQAGSKSSMDVLQKANVRVLSKSICESIYSVSSAKNKICAGTEGQDTCRGDSGGPLMIEDKYEDEGDKIVQYGITSYGNLICNGRLPGVYTDIRPYLRWILDNIKA